MSDVQKGAARVRAVERRFHALRFRTAIVSRSGQRRGKRAKSPALDGDLIALAPPDSTHPHFIVEVGGLKKSAKASFAEMRAAGPIPAGFVLLCARLTDPRRKRWRFHTEDAAYDTLAEAIA